MQKAITVGDPAGSGAFPAGLPLKWTKNGFLTEATDFGLPHVYGTSSLAGGGRAEQKIMILASVAIGFGRWSVAAVFSSKLWKHAFLQLPVVSNHSNLSTHIKQTNQIDTKM